MQTALPSEFKRGMVLMLDGAPHIVEDFHASGTAKFKQRLHTRLRHLTTGRLIDRTFAEHEQVPVGDIEHRKAQFSYKQGETYIFLDAETYDQLELPEERIGERRWFLKENDEYKAVFLDGSVIDILLPSQVVLEVTETGPVQRGGSDSTWKPAKLETGFEIMVPLFIGAGERIRVDTDERKYAGRETTGKKN